MKKIFFALATTFMLISIFPITAHAKTTLKEYPNNLRQTWYHYEGNDHYDKMKFTRKHISGYWYDTYDHKYEHYKTALHYRNLKSYKVSNHPSWSVANKIYIHKLHWINVMGWNQNAGDGDYYSTIVRTTRGKNIKILNVAGGADCWTYDHFYSTRKVAHYEKNSHWNGIVYYPKF